MNKLLRLESLKARHRRVGLVVFALVGVQLLWALWGTEKYARHGRDILWEYILYQYPALNCLLMPIIAAVLASRLCDAEHKGGTLRLLETAVSPGRLYLAKFLFGARYILSAGLLQVASVLVVGKVNRFVGGIPVVHLALFFLSTVLVGLCLLALQQALSFTLPNQMIALVAGLCGAFLGLFALYLGGWAYRVSLWSYFSRLGTVASRFAADGKSMTLWFRGYPWGDALAVAAATCLILAAGQALFARKEW